MIDLSPTEAEHLCTLHTSSYSSNPQPIQGMVSFGAVFGTRSGRPLSYRNLACDYNGRLHKAGLLKMRRHDLRHTAVTPMLLADTPLHVVSRRLGHSSIVLTANTYEHVLLSQDKDVAARMEVLLG